MSEVSTRPQKAAKSARASQKAIQTTTPAPQKTEAEVLQAQALNILMHVSSDLSEANLFNIPGAEAAATAASNIAYDLSHPEEQDKPIAPLDGLLLIRHSLETVATCLDAAPPMLIPTAISAAGLLAHVDQLASRLFFAIEGLPGSLEDLRALTTYAGAKPFRDRPTPPIRRDPAATLEPGQLSRAQLQLFMQQVAGSLGTINQTLQMAQTSDEDWQRQRLLDAAQLMTQSLGAVADHASGSTICGSIGDWMCGPFFNDLGDAA